MDQTSFRSLIGNANSFAADPFTFRSHIGAPSGGAPAPFDRLDAARMSGPSGSHPLAAIDLRELITGPTGGLEGGIELAGPPRVGEAISGTIRIRARKQIRARSAVLRLVGVHLREETRSETRTTGGPTHNADGSTGPAPTETISWVEIHARELESLPFTEPALPASLEAGQIIELPFTIPAPRLGPPTAHAGVGAIAWALEAHWDISMGSDERVAAFVDVRQHPDLLRAGVLTLPSGALDDAVTDQDVSIAVTPLPPVPAGTPLAVTITWPGAPGGRSARVELKLDVSGDNGLDLAVATVTVPNDALKGAMITLPVPADLPPTLEAPGLTVGYRIRVVVDRKLRSDVSRERPIVLC